MAAWTLLLLLDVHSTHYQPKLIRMARQKGVLILCLPPNTTRKAQPLDFGVFSPLKMHRRTVCHNFVQSNPGKVINKFNFNNLLSKEWLNTATQANIISCFKTYGIYPYNSSVILPTSDSCADSTNYFGCNPSGNDTRSKRTKTTEDDPSEFTTEQQQLLQR